jgi:pimeloyl-ACP methyl ester carboxylesterase
VAGGCSTPVITVTALAAVGGGIHTVTQAVDQATAESLPGHLIDVGDHRLYVSCTGSGEPTVILEPGLGGTSAAWAWIDPTVATHTRVCVYDRASRGRSDPSPDPQDGDQIATDLHTLLDRAGITGPLVIVGHSLGGLYVLDYAARYPQQVAGMVLLDTTPPTAFTELPDYPAIYDKLTTETGLFPGLARVGVTQLVNGVGNAELPAQAASQVRADLSTAGQARSEHDDRARGRPNQLADTANRAGSAVRQRRPPGGRRRQPPITARQPSRRRRLQPGNYRGCRRRPDRHTPRLNRTRKPTGPRRSTPPHPENS